MIDQNIVQNYPTVYLGSGIDIEYPLVLGSRKIILVDPVFRDSKIRGIVIGRIAELTGEQPSKVLESTHSFTFDFGNGREEATVTFEQEPYSSVEEVSKYKIPENIGMILCFLSTTGLTRGHNLDAQSVRDKLVPGGMILAYGEALDEATMIQKRKEFVIKNIRKGLPHDNETARQFLSDEAKWIYRKLGYESIPMRPFTPKSRAELGDVMTLLRKE